MPINIWFLQKRQNTHQGNITFVKILPGKFEETKNDSTLLKSLNLAFRRRAWGQLKKFLSVRRVTLPN